MSCCRNCWVLFIAISLICVVSLLSVSYPHMRINALLHNDAINSHDNTNKTAFNSTEMGVKMRLDWTQQLQLHAEAEQWLDSNVSHQSLPYNMLYFYKQCQILKSNIARTRKIETLRTSKMQNLGYIHIFKNAGTSILNLLSGMFSDFHLNVNNSAYADDNNNKNRVLFTFLRHPIPRFLSAFFEIHKRNTNGLMHEYRDLNVVVNESMQWFLNTMVERMNEMKLRYNSNNYSNGDNSSYDFLYPFFDIHLAPQMVFVMNETWDHLPFTYIGQNITIVDAVLPLLLRNSSIVVHHERDRNDGWYVAYRERFVIRNESFLNDHQIQQLCQLYWIDFMCFPFDIPIACDIQEMFQTHYNQQVVYKAEAQYK